MMSPDIRRLLAVRGVRAFADGYVSLLLPVYLISLGLTPLEVGVIATATLLGSGLLTLLVGHHAFRFSYRSLLLAATALMAATGFAFALASDFWPLLLIATVGTLNPSSGDVSVFLPLEQAVLARLADAKRRTSIFARYSLVGALAGACGALFAGLPELAQSTLGLDSRSALQCMFVLYGLLGIVAATIYRQLPVTLAAEPERPSDPLGRSRRTVYLMAALFSLDSFGSGFIVQSLLALWLFQKFQLSVALAGSIFFWTGTVSAFSYLVAVRIADRFGLVNTMVFTHLPSSLLLMVAPAAPTASAAAALFLAREALVEMDVPTRQSYVMAVVSPPARTYASGITNVTRNAGWAIGPIIGGSAMQHLALAAPLFIGGALKIGYDVALYRSFRHIRPPEEQR